MPRRRHKDRGCEGLVRVLAWGNAFSELNNMYTRLHSPVSWSN
jgi:hypothetical protein